MSKHLNYVDSEFIDSNAIGKQTMHELNDYDIYVARDVHMDLRL